MASESSPNRRKAGGPSISRRAMLRAGTVGAAAVGAISAFPGLLGGLVSAGPEASGVAADLTGEAPEVEGTAAELSSPIVAHITDVSSGRLSLYVGEREITYHDAQLVQRLLRASH